MRKNNLNNNSSNSPHGNIYLIFFILSLTGIICYANVLNGPFIFDDDLMVVKNKNIHSLNNLGTLFTSNLISGAGVSGGNFYRPLQALTHAIIYHFFELNPFPYHLFSLTMHIINSLLVFILMQRLAFSCGGSFWAAMIFLVHPVQTEAVSYISGLSDPLGVMFLLSGLFLFLDCYHKNSKLKTVLAFISSFLVFASALLSKESTVVFFLLVILMTAYFWNSYSREERLFRVRGIVIFILLAGIYLYLKFTVFKFTQSFGLQVERNIYTEYLSIRIFTFISILWEYTKLIFYPIHLHYEKPNLVFINLLTPSGIYGVLLIISGFIAAGYSFFKKKIFFSSFCWFFICLTPVSGIIPLNGQYLEHWLYMPMIGLLISFAAICDGVKNTSFKNVIISILITVLIAMGIRTVIRNGQWANGIAFYKNELKYTSTSARIYNNIGTIYSVEKRHDLAIKYYKEAIGIRDIYPEFHYNLGNSYLYLKELDNAIKEYYLALKLDPDFIYGHSQLFHLYSGAGQNEKAIRFKQFIETIQGGGKVSYQEIEEARSNIN